MSEAVERSVENAKLFKKFEEHLGAQPGWYCIGLVLGVATFWVPEHITLFGNRYATSKLATSLGVFIVASLLFWLGDTLNDWFWKSRTKLFADDDRFTTEALEEVIRGGGWRRALWSGLGITRGINATAVPRRDARKWMGLTKGSYKLALRLAEAAGGDLDGGVYWPNELQKGLRSFVVPLAALGAILPIMLADWRYTALLAVALGCFLGYIHLKFEHVKRLYEAVNNLRTRGKVRYVDQTFDDGRTVRQFLLEEGGAVYATLPSAPNVGEGEYGGSRDSGLAAPPETTQTPPCESLHRHSARGFLHRFECGAEIGAGLRLANCRDEMFDRSRSS
jgi:hypothetical protein